MKNVQRSCILNTGSLRIIKLTSVELMYFSRKYRVGSYYTIVKILSKIFYDKQINNEIPLRARVEFVAHPL